MVSSPEYRNELLDMAKTDQKELRGNLHQVSLLKSEKAKQRAIDKLFFNCHVRAKRMEEILDAIKTPNIHSIGSDGCEAILLITQHSYLLLMKRVLSLFQAELKKDSKSVPITYLPALIDRIMTFEIRKQKFGTQWKVDKEGVPFLVPVENFSVVNKLRAEYGLKAVHKPVNLAIGAVKYPLGKGLASAEDQKELTDDEYKQMTRNMLKSML